MSPYEQGTVVNLKTDTEGNQMDWQGAHGSRPGEDNSLHLAGVFVLLAGVIIVGGLLNAHVVASVGK